MQVVTESHRLQRMEHVYRILLEYHKDPDFLKKITHTDEAYFETRRIGGNGGWHRNKTEAAAHRFVAQVNYSQMLK